MAFLYLLEIANFIVLYRVLVVRQTHDYFISRLKVP
jgi:hypothetical protein